jgi:redox-sensitive bicupin YhaK (pirin superfamily)
MKIEVHKNEERGKGEYGWLSTRYSFSFSNWYNPARMGFGKLRVLNDDVIAPYSGFPTHGHRDMEIITIVMRGIVSHKDSMGNERKVEEGMVQVMSAGTGVMHSEYNNEDVPLELFQLWIESQEKGIAPRYEEKKMDFLKNEDASVVLVGNGGITINQNASIMYVSSMTEKEEVYTLQGERRGVYLFVIEGTVTVEGVVLSRRDAAAISDTHSFLYTLGANTKAVVVETPL